MAVEIKDICGRFQPPVLLVSTRVGRGNISIAEAMIESFPGDIAAHHVCVEDLLPARAVREDLARYKLISNRFRFLLQLIYRVPFFYYRKYLRERFMGQSDLGALAKKIAAVKARTVICVSHRPTFWVSDLRSKSHGDFKLWGVMTEFGPSLGWDFVFWDAVDGVLSPLEKKELGLDRLDRLDFVSVRLPAKKEYQALAAVPGRRDNVLLVCGYWGQADMYRLVRRLSAVIPGFNIFVVCGENQADHEKIRRSFAGSKNIKVFGQVDSLAPFFKECASVITKPGMATLLEAYAARRKIFLLKGMPVAEDNNARYALSHFGAEWFDPGKFMEWSRAE